MSATLTDPRLAALARANEVRSQRSALKRDLRCALVTLADLLEDPPECIATMAIGDLLVAAPALGVVKADEVLRVLHMPPSIAVGQLREKRRLAILDTLADRYPGICWRWGLV